MKDSVYRLKPGTIEEPESLIIQVWNEFSQDRINNLIIGFHQRLQLITINGGESIQPNLIRNLHSKNLVIPNKPNNVSYWNDVLSKLTNEQDKEPDNSPFTSEEDEIISNFFIRYGPKWTLISKKLPNRTTIQIKNRYNSYIKKGNFLLTQKF